MASALIGHTGFVGGNLLRQTHFDHTYNSANIEDIEGKHYQWMVCAGAPAVKWKANQEPERDLANLERLMKCLEKTSADHVILISTIDVYPRPLQVDEDTAIDPDAGSPYGKHRLLLEKFIRDRFESTIIRLPGLFGPGLKKNIIYDFLHDNRVDSICPDSVFQFYPVVKVWEDIQVARRNHLRLVNFATEPTSVREVAEKAFGLEFHNPKVSRPVRYDMRTKHSRPFGKAGPYLYEAEEVLKFLEDYITSMGWARP
jgi:nucleoside-diphosphate-sugar epimerase